MEQKNLGITDGSTKDKHMNLFLSHHSMAERGISPQTDTAVSNRLLAKPLSWGWGNGWVVKVLATQVWRPHFGFIEATINAGRDGGLLLIPASENRDKDCQRKLASQTSHIDKLWVWETPPFEWGERMEPRMVLNSSISSGVHMDINACGFAYIAHSCICTCAKTCLYTCTTIYEKGKKKTLACHCGLNKRQEKQLKASCLDGKSYQW